VWYTYVCSFCIWIFHAGARRVCSQLRSLRWRLRVSAGACLSAARALTRGAGIADTAGASSLGQRWVFHRYLTPAPQSRWEQTPLRSSPLRSVQVRISQLSIELAVQKRRECSWAGKRGINHRPSLCYQRRNPQTPVKPNYPPTARMGTSRFKQTLLSVRWRDPRHTEPETNPKAASQHQNEPCPPAPRPLTVPRGEPGLPAPLLQPKGAELPAGASIGPGPLPLAASPAGQRTGTRSRQGRRATAPRVPAAPSETKAAAHAPAAAAACPAQRPAIFLCLPTGVKHSLPVNSSRVYYQISKILHFLLYPNSLYCVWQYR